MKTISKKDMPKGGIEYDLKEDRIVLQTGDQVICETKKGAIEGYFDGTIRWNPEVKEWMLQIRTGETDAKDAYNIRKIILQNE